MDQGSSNEQQLLSTLFLSSLDSDVDNKELFTLFKDYGIIKLTRSREPRKQLTALIQYSSKEEAAEAKEKLQYKKVGKFDLIVMNCAERNSLRPEGKIFLNNIPTEPATQSKDLHNLFSVISPNLHVFIVTDHQGNKLDFGYVHFSDPKDADKALEEPERWKLSDKTLQLKRWGDTDTKGEKCSPNLYARNFPEEMDKPEVDNKLKEIFSQFGDIHSLVVTRSPEYRSYFAFISFKELKSAQDAYTRLNSVPLTMEGAERPLLVQWEKSKEEIEAEKNIHGLYIKNLKSTVTKEELQQFFERFCPVKNINLQASYHLTQFAVIALNSEEDAQTALAKAPKSEGWEDLFSVQFGPFISQWKPRNERDIEEINQRKQLKEWEDEEREKGPSNLYVRNLPTDLEKAQLEIAFEKFFSEFGEIRSKIVTWSPEYKNYYALVSYKDPKSAKKALEELNENPRTMEGAKDSLIVRWYTPKEEKVEEDKQVGLYIKNLKSNVTKDDLLQHFKKICPCKIIDLQVSHHQTQFAIVGFNGEKDAAKAFAKAPEIEGWRYLFAVQFGPYIGYWKPKSQGRDNQYQANLKQKTNKPGQFKQQKRTQNNGPYNEPKFNQNNAKNFNERNQEELPPSQLNNPLLDLAFPSLPTNSYQSAGPVNNADAIDVSRLEEQKVSEVKDNSTSNQSGLNPHIANLMNMLPQLNYQAPPGLEPSHPPVPQNNYQPAWPIPNPSEVVNSNSLEVQNEAKKVDPSASYSNAEPNPYEMFARLAGIPTVQGNLEQPVAGNNPFFVYNNNMGTANQTSFNPYENAHHYMPPPQQVNYQPPPGLPFDQPAPGINPYFAHNNVGIPNQPSFNPYENAHHFMPPPQQMNYQPIPQIPYNMFSSPSNNYQQSAWPSNIGSLEEPKSYETKKDEFKIPEMSSYSLFSRPSGTTPTNLGNTDHQTIGGIGGNNRNLKEEPVKEHEGHLNEDLERLIKNINRLNMNILENLE